MDERYEEIMGEITALKSLLRDTDYRAIKFAEGELTAEEFAGTKANRAAWRAEINVLEAELATLEPEAAEGGDEA